MEEKKKTWPFSGVSVREVPTKAGEHEDWKSPRFIPRVASVFLPKTLRKDHGHHLCCWIYPFLLARSWPCVTPQCFSPVVLALRVSEFPCGLQLGNSKGLIVHRSLMSDLRSEHSHGNADQPRVDGSDQAETRRAPPTRHSSQGSGGSAAVT